MALVERADFNLASEIQQREVDTFIEDNLRGEISEDRIAQVSFFFSGVQKSGGQKCGQKCRPRS